MDEQLKKAWEAVKGLFAKINKKVKILLGVVLALAVLGTAAYFIWAGSRPYQVLFTGLSDSEASSIVSYLEENGVSDYQINGDSILVPEDQENQLKAELVMSGYPKSGYLYESYFNNVSGMSTNSERDTAFRIALQERLEAVIRCFDGVKEASVNIAPGKDQTYVLDDKSKVNASASVVITLGAGVKLSAQQADAIRTMVSRSVQGLAIDDVSITDNLGNRYAGTDGFSSISDGSALKLKLEEQTNNQVRANILQALADVFGTENVRVAVNSVVDVNRKVVESTEFTQPAGANTGAGLIGSETWLYQVSRGEEPAEGGTTGTSTNAQIPEYVQGQLEVNGDEKYSGSSGERNYDNNKTVEQVEVVSGTVTDISVAVTINQSSSNATSINQAALLRHVAMASGIGSENPEGKINILVAPFFEEDAPSPLPGVTFPPMWMIYAAAGGLLVFLILLIIVLRIRSKRRKKLAKRLADEMEAAALAQVQTVTAGADIMEMNAEKSMELRKVVRQFAQNNPEIAAQMIKGWLRGEEDNG